MSKQEEPSTPIATVQSDVEGVREPEIRTGRGLALSPDVLITETIDTDGMGRARHAGRSARVHERLLVERRRYLERRIVEQQKSKRQAGWAAVVLLVAAALIFSFGSATPSVVSAAVLVFAAGAAGFRSLRVKSERFELQAGTQEDE